MAIRAKETERHDYAAKLLWTGAKAGPTSSYQAYSREYEYQCGDKPAVRGSADPDISGDASLYNPEELLHHCRTPTCHLLSLPGALRASGVHVVSYEDDAHGTMTVRDGKVRFTDAVLRPRVTVAAGTNPERAQALHDAAHDECYIAAL
jgi:organic hydroperoxide reductase OsmC/OhrA